MSFVQFNLDARLMTGIQRAGYTDPTPIQTAAMPAALTGQDLIGTAQTGTGKTAAFVLPILNKLVNGARNRTRALIVTPTRELAEQIHDTISQLGNATNLRSATIYGGVGATPQIKALRSGVEILVACPGRLLDLIAQGHAKLDFVEFLVLDEADRMFDMGFLPDVKRIIARLPVRRQTMLFSATFPREIEQLASQTLRNPQRIAIGLSRPAITVTHALYPVPQHLKAGLLMQLLKRTDTNSVLIFTRTKHRAQKLAMQIENSGFRVTSLHGNRSQGQRQEALNGFKRGRYQIMVATDIAARGLDVESISHVINYDIPDTADAYIHRIGRTGRMERAGDAFTLVTPEDHEMVRELEKIMGQKLPKLTLEDYDYSVAAPAKPVVSQRPPRQTLAARGVKVISRPASRFQQNHRTGNK
ncbi:MAG: RNA helicase [Chloroflexi bacterium GWB2_49_20]|nr:MAG: RNA helicase [Chloroflexi bacterium GWB2_49_20]OGN79399.1 MAG: RNA helicase [Chloroflexi bacterium GWC2_49_37]OGN82831.1 MAG: RNA helicase [Chloroflexi bacterium GWD2_49_16]